MKAKGYITITNEDEQKLMKQIAKELRKLLKELNK